MQMLDRPCERERPALLAEAKHDGTVNGDTAALVCKFLRGRVFQTREADETHLPTTLFLKFLKGNSQLRSPECVTGKTGRLCCKG
jgi:hypothetical protein